MLKLLGTFDKEKQIKKRVTGSTQKHISQIRLPDVPENRDQLLPGIPINYFGDTKLSPPPFPTKQLIIFILWYVYLDAYGNLTEMGTGRNVSLSETKECEDQ